MASGLERLNEIYDRGPETLAWVRKADVALEALHRAIHLAKKIQGYQNVEPCVCRSAHVRDLRVLLDQTQSHMERLINCLHDTHTARRSVLLASSLVSRAIGWVDKALDFKGESYKRILHLLYKYVWACLSEFPTDGPIEPSDVRKLLIFGIRPRLVVCPCEAQFNSYAVRGYLDLCNKILVTTVFMAWMLFPRHPLTSIPLGPKELDWINNAPENLTSYTCTSLHQRVYMENVWHLRHILENLDELDTPDSLGTTPLHLAAAFLDGRAANLLVGATADANTHDLEGNTPLQAAILMGDRATIGALRRGGAEVTGDDAGSCPLRLAIALEDSRAMEALVGKMRNT